MRRRQPRLAAALGVAAMVALGPALADEALPPTAVEIDLPECSPEPLDYATFVRLLTLELRQDGVVQVGEDLEPGDRTAVLTLSGKCSAIRRRARLSIHPAPGGAARRRILDLSELPDDLAARALALGAAELVRASWRGDVAPFPGEQEAPEDEEPAPPAPPPSPTVATPPAPPPPRPEPPGRRAPSRDGISVEVGAHAKTFLDRGDVLWGGRLGAEWRRARFGVALVAGRAEGDLGAVSARVLHASLGYDVLRAGDARQGLALGPRLSAGILAAEGDAQGGATDEAGEAPYLEGTVDLAARLVVARPVSAWVALEGGYARGATLLADDRALAAVGGLVAGATVGLAIVP